MAKINSSVNQFPIKEIFLNSIMSLLIDDVINNLQIASPCFASLCARCKHCFTYLIKYIFHISKYLLDKIMLVKILFLNSRFRGSKRMRNRSKASFINTFAPEAHAARTRRHRNSSLGMLEDRHSPL